MALSIIHVMFHIPEIHAMVLVLLFSSYCPERHQTLGPDLSAAHFVVSRDGAVKFEGIDRWIRKNINGKHYLPSSPQMNMKLEAIDASNTQMMYTSFDNFCKWFLNKLLCILVYMLI